MELKPKEITNIKYWLHLLIIAIIVLSILQYLKGGEMLTIKNVLWSVPLLGISDIASHSILNID